MTKPNGEVRMREAIGGPKHGDGCGCAICSSVAAADGLPEGGSRTRRDYLVSRVEVLDKVGVLRTLPDGLHVTTAMVAEFYGVGVEAVKSLVKDNRAEIEEDGYRVVVRSEFERSYTDLSNVIDPRARQIALLPRRAVLRVGMLLRDSAVAKQVRTYLLEVEQNQRVVIEWSDPIAAIEHQMLLTQQAIDVAKAERTQRIALEAQVEQDHPLVERALGHRGGHGNVSRTDFGREVIAWASARGVRVMHVEIREFLATKLHLFVGGKRTDTGQATTWAIRQGYGHNRKTTVDNDRNVFTGQLTPAGQAYAWERCVRYVEEHGNLILAEEATR